MRAPRNTLPPVTLPPDTLRPDTLPPNTLPPRKVFSRDGLASRVPVKESSAGSSVSEAITVMATVAAAAIATPFSSAWRSTSSPSMPMTTVVPAVSTARPAVRMAVTTASGASRPACSSLAGTWSR